MSLRNILILALFCISLAVKGNPLVSEADSAYNKGNYEEAIQLYQQVVNEYGTSASLLYNLGNSYLQNDDYANAMLCYQRAKKLDPSNKRINRNLTYLSGKIEDANKAEQKGKRKKVTYDTPNFFQTIHNSVAVERSSNTWAGVAATAFLLFSGCVALYLFNSNVMLRKTGFFGGFILLGISMICLVCAYSGAAEAENHEYGIIMAYKVDLKTEPNSKSTTGNDEGVLTRGTKIRIISEETDAEGTVNWYKVRLNSDYIGWIEAKEIEVI